MTLLLQLNLGFAWGDSSGDALTPWIETGALGYTTHASGYSTTPTVIRSVDVGQVYQADVDE